MRGGRRERRFADSDKWSVNRDAKLVTLQLQEGGLLEEIII
jgi:hypothetical protein